jgi:hypothetical protein
MKKWLFVLAGLLLSLALALPLAIGLGLEQGVNLLLPQLTNNPAAAVVSSLFERGYGTSQLSLVLKPQLDGSPQSVSLLVHFRHGPLLTGGRLELGLLGINLDLKVAPSPQVTIAPDDPLYHLDGRIGLFGAATFVDHYNPISLNLAAGQGQWSRGEGAGRINWQAKRLDYEGRLSQLSWRSPNLVVNLADTQIAKQLSLSGYVINWFSRIAFKALNAQLQEQAYWLQQGALGISGQASAALATEGLDAVPARWQLSLVAEDYKSKAVQLTSLDANLALDQVPAAWLVGFAALASNPGSSEEFAGQAAALAKKHIKLPAELLIERIGAVQEGKTFWFTGRVPLAPLTTMPPAAWNSVEATLAQLSGNGEIHLEKTLVPVWAKSYLEASGNGQSFSPAQIEVLAKAFVGQGMLTEMGDHYSCKVGFKPGEITLNEKPVLLPF